ncbi:MAG: hypothetical protein ABI639_15080 [Thermoanaerobaculia bacterium]
MRRLCVGARKMGEMITSSEVSRTPPAERAGALSTCALLMFASVASAGVNTWTQIHPTGHSIRVVRQQPNTLYAIDHQPARDGLLRSLDRGLTWQLLPVEVDGNVPFLTDLAIDPNDPNHICATSGLSSWSVLNGLICSSNAGADWTLRSVPGTCLRHATFAFDPLRSERIYLSTDYSESICPSSCPNAISDNSGVTWRCADLPEVGDRTRRMVPSPFERDVVLAVGYSGLYRSSDAGKTWILVEPTPAFPAPPVNFENLFTDVVWATDQIAYAASDGAGVYRSEDGGENWFATLPFPTQLDSRPWVSNLVVDTFHPQDVFGLVKASASDSIHEVARSPNGGFGWYNPANWLGVLTGIAIDPVTPNRVYVSSQELGLLAYDFQERSVAGDCFAYPVGQVLCIKNNRFRVESRWRDFAGHSGIGHAEPQSEDSGAFWFFSPENLELFVKEVDGRAFNDSFWTFYGALSNVEFTVLVKDMETGAQHGYFNRSGNFASQGDIESFPQGEAQTAPTSTPLPNPLVSKTTTAAPRSTSACTPSATTLCLRDGRFAASVTWHDFTGHTGAGHPLPITSDTGSFWFFDAGIYELAVKVIDGRGTNDAYWVFYGSLSNVAFELRIVDTTTGESWTRSNPSGTFASGGDIEAFPQLP